MAATRILVLYYSQSGQLTQVLQSMLAPLCGRADVELVWEPLVPTTPYPFPWSFFEFLDVFPESVHMVPPPLQPPSFAADAHFDLVVVAYQVWFLSPSPPIVGFLKSPAAQVLRDKPVISVIACRNMWLVAHEKMRTLLAAGGARLIDNVVLVDQGPPWATFITTPRWLLTGKKDGFWGIFPPAGVAADDIKGAARFGRALADNLHLLHLPAPGPLLSELRAVKVRPGYIVGERIGHRSFLIWGKLLRALGPAGTPLRRIALVVYLIFLIAMIVTVLPISLLVRALVRPFIRRHLEREIARLEQPSGSGDARLARYS